MIELKWKPREQTSAAELALIDGAKVTGADAAIYGALKLTATTWTGTDVKFSPDHFETTISPDDARRLYGQLRGHLGLPALAPAPAAEAKTKTTEKK